MYAKHLLGDTTGPRPIVAPGSVAPTLGVEFGVGAERRDSPAFILGGSVSMGIGLGMTVAPGEAVSAGPVWDVSRYLLTDGAVSLTGPSITLTPPYEIVIGFSRDSAANDHFPASLNRDTSVREWVALYAAGSYHGLLALSQVGPYVAGAELGAVAFCPTRGTAAAAEPGLGFDGAAITYGGGTVARPAGATTIYIGRWHSYASAAGLKIRWVGVVASGEMSSGSRTAVAGSPLSDPRDPLRVCVGQTRGGPPLAVAAAPFGMFVIDAAGVPFVVGNREVEAGRTVGGMEFHTHAVCVLERHAERVYALAPQFPPRFRRQTIADAVRIGNPFVSGLETDLSGVIHAVAHAALPVHAGKIGVAERFEFQPDVVGGGGPVLVGVAPGVVMAVEAPVAATLPVLLKGADFSIAQRDEFDISEPSAIGRIANRLAAFRDHLPDQLPDKQTLPGKIGVFEEVLVQLVARFALMDDTRKGFVAGQFHKQVSRIFAAAVRSNAEGNGVPALAVERVGHLRCGGVLAGDKHHTACGAGLEIKQSPMSAARLAGQGRLRLTSVEVGKVDRFGFVAEERNRGGRCCGRAFEEDSAICHEEDGGR